MRCPLACLLLLAPGAIRAERTVAVNSSVDSLYALRREENPERRETFVFARGQYFNPVPMDRTLERMEFGTIAATLAKDLKKNRYEPAASVLVADLILVVHWGVTQPNETTASSLIHNYDLMRETANAVNEARELSEDPATRNQLGVPILENVMATQVDFRSESANTLSANVSNEVRRQTTVELLGLQNSLYEAEDAAFSSSLGDTIRQMMNEERYFVIVMAYEGRALREGRKKRLWTTRASMRGPGVNFAEALRLLSGTAGEFHGVPQRGLVFAPTPNRSRQRQEEVIIGELKVLGDTSAPVRPGKR